MNSAGAYMVTAGTFQKEHFFTTSIRLDLLQQHLFTLANTYEWFLQAWAIFPNHYHFIAQSPKDPATLKAFITALHSLTAKAINQEDKTPLRRVWYQYWDSHLTHQTSYMARLNYVHNNPVKHGIVQTATHYPWCSAGWFEEHSAPPFRKSVLSFKTDQLNVYDEF
jgi:putative transposase